MTDAGFERIANQCHEKIKKLRAEYKKVKNNNNQTGNNRKTCKFYEKLDNVLGSKPATRPSIVIDSFESSSGNNSCDSQKSDDDESASNNEQTLDLSTEKSEEKSPPSDLSSDQTGEHHDKKPLAKKKRSRDEKMEKAMGTLVSGITKAISSSDERFIQLEEKRIKLDEMMLKMEED